MSNTKNQSSYKDNQNYQIDIDAIYSSFIKEIDATRSHTNITNGSNQSVLNSFKDETFDSIKQKVVVDEKLQESRVHAFYRLVGFPVASKDKIYNPGLDNLKDKSRTIDKSYKIKVANAPLDGFKDLSTKRELYIQSMLDIFSFNTTIDASVLALSSGANVREFIVPFNNEDVFDTKINNQSYVINDKNNVGKNKVSLFEFNGPNGKDDLPEKVFKLKRYHIIKPFIVDARIDLSVTPSNRLVAIPFLFNKTQTMVSDDTFVKRPLIERVIRDRFSTFNQISTAGTKNKQLTDYIQSVPSITDNELIKKAQQTDIYGLQDQAKFLEFIKIIRAMISELVDSQAIIRKTQSNYYYVPIPDVNGPEFGCTDGGIIQTDNAKLLTDNDRDLIDGLIRKQLDAISADTANLNAEPDVDGFVFDDFFQLTTSKSKVTKDVSDENLNNLLSKRKKLTEATNDSLRIIEIIMGEFSGFGLCDIIAILGGLYLMPKQDLLGFLDIDALARMNKILKLSEASVDFQKAQESLASSVIGFYNIMDKIYQDENKRNGISK